jgi:hypothetical protein
MGAAMAFIWSPLAATATRNLPPTLAGAGSGVYNATRQVGSVLGSAGMAAFMASRLSAEIPGAGDAAPQGEGAAAQLPAFLHVPFASAMSQSMLLPAFIALFGVIAALFLLGGAPRVRQTRPADARGDDGGHVSGGHALDDGDALDDDDYVEYEVDWSHAADTDRLTRVEQPGARQPRAEEPAPSPVAGGDGDRRGILDDLMPADGGRRGRHARESD